MWKERRCVYGGGGCVSVEGCRCVYGGGGCVSVEGV